MTPEKLKEAQVYIDFVKTNLTPLAEHLKVSVDWLWDILVQQIRVEAIVYLIIVLTLTIKSTVLLIVAFKSLKGATFYSDNRGGTVYRNKKTGEEKDYYRINYSELDNYERVVIPNTTNLKGHLVRWCGGAGAALAVIATITTAVTLPARHIEQPDDNPGELSPEDEKKFYEIQRSTQ